MHNFDFHSHSTSSDGSLSAKDLTLRAFKLGLKRFSLTDHDSVFGLKEAREMAKSYHIDFINGCELSTTWQGSTIHILAYAFDNDNEVLFDYSQLMQAKRLERAKEISYRLDKINIKNSLEETQELMRALGIPANIPPARPHFAKLLVKNGYAKDINQAFDKYLGNGKIGDVKKFWFDFEQTMQLIQNAKALSSIAHPLKYKLTTAKMKRLFKDFIELKGDAIELVNGNQDKEKTTILSDFVKQNNLKITAGSDFHFATEWQDLGKFSEFDKTQLEFLF